MPNYKVVIAGTSHVRRLRDAIDEGSDPAFEAHFGLSQISTDFVCGGGWGLEDIVRHQSQILRSKPHVLVLQVGSNDICSADCCPLIIADALLDTACHLQQCGNISSVIVCHLLPRSLGVYMPTAEAVSAYTLARVKFNQFIDVVASDYTKVKVWKHKKLFNPIQEVLLSDGVHLNTSGQYKFYKSLRGAILFALGHF